MSDKKLICRVIDPQTEIDISRVFRLDGRYRVEFPNSCRAGESQFIDRVMEDGYALKFTPVPEDPEAVEWLMANDPRLQKKEMLEAFKNHDWQPPLSAPKYIKIGEPVDGEEGYAPGAVGVGMPFWQVSYGGTPKPPLDRCLTKEELEAILQRRREAHAECGMPTLTIRVIPDPRNKI